MQNSWVPEPSFFLCIYNNLAWPEWLEGLYCWHLLHLLQLPSHFFSGWVSETEKRKVYGFFGLWITPIISIKVIIWLLTPVFFWLLSSLLSFFLNSAYSLVTMWPIVDYTNSKAADIYVAVLLPPLLSTWLLLQLLLLPAGIVLCWLGL